MKIDTFEAVAFALAFIVPGFVGYSVLAALIPQRVTTAEVTVIRFFSFSCVNYALWAVPVYWALKANLIGCSATITSAH